MSELHAGFAVRIIPASEAIVNPVRGTTRFASESLSAGTHAARLSHVPSTTRHIWRRFIKRACLFGLALLTGVPVGAQNFATNDPVLRAIWEEGATRSQVAPLMQTLTDSIGPRLTGTPGIRAGNDWAVAMYTRWGVSARNEQYGTWNGWRRGITHVDLIAPRVRTLEATMLAWSPGTPRGRPVEGPVMLLPDLPDSAAYTQWMRSVRGAFVAISFPEPTCRPQANWETWAGEAAATSVFDARRDGTRAFNERVTRTGYTTRTLPVALEQAGAVGILTSDGPWDGVSTTCSTVGPSGSPRST